MSLLLFANCDGARLKSSSKVPQAHIGYWMLLGVFLVNTISLEFMRGIMYYLLSQNQLVADIKLTIFFQ